MSSRHHPNRVRGPLAVAVCAAAGWMLWPQHALPHETITTTVLFDREIVRILNKHCVMCHAANGPSFPLETYEQTWIQARKIRAAVIARHMPPWSAFPGYGLFANDNSLTLRETQFMVSWVEGSGPRNAGTVFTNTADPKAVPRKEIRAAADFDHWQLGEPELKLSLPANRIEPQSAADVRRVVSDSGLTTERRLRGLEYMPGDRRVVRAAFFTVQETGDWIGSWTPWYGFMNLPKGSAWKLPAGCHIVAEIHYKGVTEPITERGMLGLSFADGPAPNTVSAIVVEAKAEVPAGATAQRVRAATRLSVDIEALALRLEFQAGLQSVEVAARKPDGATEVMLFAKNLNADWPSPYIFRSPVHVAKGSELTATGYYANNSAAPLNRGIRLTVNKVQVGR